MGMKQRYLIIPSNRHKRKRVGEGKKSREAGDDGGNHGYKDGSKTDRRARGWRRDYLQLMPWFRAWFHN